MIYDCITSTLLVQDPRPCSRGRDQLPPSSPPPCWATSGPSGSRTFHHDHCVHVHVLVCENIKGTHLAGNVAVTRDVANVSIFII